MFDLQSIVRRRCKQIARQCRNRSIKVVDRERLNRRLDMLKVRLQQNTCHTGTFKKET